MKRHYAIFSVILIFFAFFPDIARAQPPVFETVVRKVFGTNRVVFTHNSEEKLQNDQKIYLYSGETLIGTGRICSIYADENYTCEVPVEVYESISPGDMVSNLPPEKFRQELKRIEDNLKRAKAAVSPPLPGVAGREEDDARMTPPKTGEPETRHTWQDMVLTGDALVARGDTISLQTAEEKYLTALKMTNAAGKVVITPLEALASLYMDHERCSEAARLLEIHLPPALADYPSDAWAEAISSMNIQTNNLIYSGKFACAEMVLTRLAAALEPETRDERTGFFIISVFERLSYLYGEWGKEGKADAYREKSGRIKEEYNIERYLKEEDLLE